MDSKQRYPIASEAELRAADRMIRRTDAAILRNAVRIIERRAPKKASGHKFWVQVICKTLRAWARNIEDG